MLSAQQLQALNAGLNPWPEDASLVNVPIRPSVGIVHNGGTDTHLISSKDTAGLLLRPGVADSGTVTLHNQAPSAFGAYALQQCGYVTLDGTQSIKIGNANISIAESHFLAVLCRINKSTMIEGQNKTINLARTTQQTDGRYNRQMIVTGSASSTPSSVARRCTSYVCEGFSAGPTAASQRLTSDWSSTYRPAYTPAIYPDAYGDNGASETNETPNSDWCWHFVRGSAAGESESNCESLMSSSGGTHAARKLSIGHMWVPRHGLVIPNSMTCLTVPTNSIGTDSGSLPYATPAFSAQDWVLGANAAGTTLDVACVIHLSRFPRLLDVVLILQGIHPADMGLSPVAGSDFVCWLASKAQGEASSGLTLTETGTPAYSAAGGPTLLRKLSSVGVAGNTTISVASGVAA